MIQLAWLWLRYQPGSDLAEWFRKRVGTLAGRTRRIAIVAGSVAADDTGNATVFVFGGTWPPRFRWVASRWGYASCMRHSGAGRGPTACKVTQP